MKEYNYNVVNKVYEDMLYGRKKLEVRLLKEKSEAINIGDVIVFNNQEAPGKYISVKVVGKTIVKDIFEFHEKFSTKDIMPFSTDYELDMKLREIYGDALDTNRLVIFEGEYITSDVEIEIDIDKEPYSKKLTSHKIINLTGESGSGKSYYSNKYSVLEDYIVVDTDTIFGSAPVQNKECAELKKIFEGKDSKYLINNFDEAYLKILEFFKDSDKTIVIDSAQYRNIKDYSILKGEIIVMRASINTCYQRCIDRWTTLNNDNYTPDELREYSERKQSMYHNYKSLNTFIINVEKTNR